MIPEHDFGVIDQHDESSTLNSDADTLIEIQQSQPSVIEHDESNARSADNGKKPKAFSSAYH
jgi:hypothetical protein